MKKKLACLIVFLAISVSAISQNETFDIILKTNGEEMVGSVTAIDDDTIEFVYKNEAINYKVKNSDIVKITFSSGRIQFFNKLKTEGNSITNLESHHNLVAILPFGYIKDQDDGSDMMSNKIQRETYLVFNKYKAELKYQDPNTTNALLIKAGVRNNNIQGYTMGEICHILNVEYVIQGVVSVSATNQTNYGTTQTTSKGNGKLRVDSNGNLIGDIYGDGKKKTSTFDVSTTVQNYATSMTMNIYNDRGENIFSQDHTAFWQMQDAYKITLKYLVKKTPLYKR